MSQPTAYDLRKGAEKDDEAVGGDDDDLTIGDAVANVSDRRIKAPTHRGSGCWGQANNRPDQDAEQHSSLCDTGDASDTYSVETEVGGEFGKKDRLHLTYEADPRDDPHGRACED